MKNPSSIAHNLPFVTTTADTDVERRWTAWTGRGLADERLVRTRSVALAMVIAVIAVGALVAYGVRFS